MSALAFLKFGLIVYLLLI